jgi:hypothetical protein
VDAIKRELAEAQRAATQQQQQPKPSAPAQTQAKPAAPAQQQQHPGNCTGCGRPLSGRVANINGKMWHVDCFVCFQCKRSLEGGYAEYSGKPICIVCVEDIKARQAQQQQRANQEQAQFLQQQQQAQGQAPGQEQGQTMTCMQCKKTFEGEYMEFKGNTFCIPCAEALQKGTISSPAVSVDPGKKKKKKSYTIFFLSILEIR